LHWRPRKELYTALGRSDLFFKKTQTEVSNVPDKAIVTTLTSKHRFFIRVENTFLFDQTLVVFASQSDFLLGVLSSSAHQIWALKQGGTQGTTPRYIQTDCFETFPLPEAHAGVEIKAKNLEDARRRLMDSRELGLTNIYNAFHSPTELAEDFRDFRALQVELDREVLRAYGWHDIDVDHVFFEITDLPENDRVRFTFSDKTRAEILRRLSELNKRRHDEEAKDAPSTSSTGPTRARASKVSGQAELSFDAPSQSRSGSTTSVSVAADRIASHLKVRRSWMSKSDILAYVDIPDGQWNAAINDLLENGIVERQGERRGARYRISESD